MKKFLLSIITFIYLMMSSGIAMDVHYCMGKRSGVDFCKIAESKCGKCGMKEKKGGCCHDEHSFLKLSNDHTIAAQAIVPQNYFSEIGTTPVLFSYTPFLLSPIIVNAPAHAPPYLHQKHICIRNCVFRI